jgi:hypothetical protein
MAILTYKCPHCLTEHIGLRVIAITPSQPGAAVHLSCPKCNKPSSAVIVTNRPIGSIVPRDNLTQLPGEITEHGWAIEEFWPAPPGPIIPELLPPEVERIYLQGERNFPVAGNEEAAGTMYRKALDVGLKIIDPAVTGVLKVRNPTQSGQ